ncbi:MAG: 2-oxo-4-hydroxy-4-carboxy-5-ureidoimidazoline decarboxylase [Lysobacterales bacterium]
MDQASFVKRFGGVFENSPWVAETVFDHGGSLLKHTESLGELFESVFLCADPALQIATLSAHPQLACALAGPDDLSADSLSEQSAAGLDRCSAEEYAAFSDLNSEYNDKFGFPFIIAVKGLTRREILESFRERLRNQRSLEFQNALKQTCRIARFRIGDILRD